MPTLSDNITKVINEYDDIQAAIIEKGVDVPHGTPTSEYGAKVRQIIGGGGTWEGEFPPGWEEDHVGIAIENISQYDPILWQQLGTSEIPFYGTEQLDIGGGVVNGIALSANGSRMVCALQTAPFVRVYNYITNTGYVSAPIQPTQFTTACSSCAISPDGNMIFITKANQPYLTVLKWDGAQYLNIPLDIAVSVGAVNVALSPDGKTVFVGYDRSPFLSVYSVGINSLTKLENPDVMPSGVVYRVLYSPNGETVIVSCNGTLNIIAYRVVDNSFINIPTATITAPNGTIRYMDWSPDGLYLIMQRSSSTTEPLYLYKFENDTLSRLQGSTLSSAITSAGVIWTENRIFMIGIGANLLCAHVVNDELKYIDDQLPLLFDVSVTGNGQFLSKSTDRSTIVLGNNSLIVYGSARKDIVKKINNIKNIQGDIGFAKETVSKDSPCQVNVFPILRGD